MEVTLVLIVVIFAVNVYLARPVLDSFLRERFGGWTKKDIAQTLGSMRSVYAGLPGDGYDVEIPEMFHVNFTDLPYWLPLAPQLGLTRPIDGQRGFDIVNAYSIAFFDKESKGQLAALLDGPADTTRKCASKRAGRNPLSP